MEVAPRTGTQTAARTSRGLFYGWVVVGAGFWVDFLSYGIVTVALGVLFPVLSERLDAGRGLLSGALLLHASTVAAVSPFLGPVVDRRGPRALLGAGALLLGLGTAALAIVESPWHFYAVYGVVMALGYAGLSDPVNHATVSQWFVRRRGRALGFVTMGFSVAGIMLPLPITAALDLSGWRGTCIALGLVASISGLVASRLMLHRPESRGLLPDGEPRAPATDPPAVPDAASADAVRAAVRTRAFWLLLFGANAAGLALFGINLHLVSYLHDRGLSLTTAAVLVTVLYVCQTLAKPLWGFTAERLPVRVCLMLCYLGGAVGVLLLLLGRSVPTVLPFVLVYGLTRGAQSLMVSLAWAEYFGRGIQGRVRGLAAPFRIISTAGGPIFAGVLFDTTGDYTIAFLVFAVMFLVGGGLSLAARPPRTA
jgi:MFS transporter, OFA family, oxalate/formate antiporter